MPKIDRQFTPGAKLPEKDYVNGDATEAGLNEVLAKANLAPYVFTTVAEAEAAEYSNPEVVAVAETNQFYVYDSASVLPSDGNFVLNTGGTGRLISIMYQATLNLGAGTATYAPLKLTTGALLATSEAGAVEFVNDDYYATVTTGAGRKKVVLTEGLTPDRIPYATTNGRITDTSDLAFDGTSMSLGTSIDTDTRSTVQGLGNNSTTYAKKIKNGDGVDIATFRDDGFVSVDGTLQTPTIQGGDGAGEDLILKSNPNNDGSVKISSLAEFDEDTGITTIAALTISSSGTNPVFTSISATGTNGTLSFVTAGNRNRYKIDRISDSHIWTNELTDSMWLNATGLGVGITPDARLHVRGSSNNSATNTACFENGDGVESMCIRDDGLVEIPDEAQINKISAIGSFRTKSTPVNAATYTVLASDHTIAVAHTPTAPVAVTLPPLSTAWDASTNTGQVVIFKDIGGNAKANNITVSADAGDGAAILGFAPSASVTIEVDLDTITVVAVSATQWAVINNKKTPVIGEIWEEGEGQKTADSITLNAGVVASGTVVDSRDFNQVYYQIQEVAATPGFDAEFHFTLDNVPGKLTFIGRYDGQPSHNVVIEAWNYTTMLWDSFSGVAQDVPDGTLDLLYAFDYADLLAQNGSVITDYISGTDAKIRFQHTTAGTATHDFYIDFVAIQERQFTVATPGTYVLINGLTNGDSTNVTANGANGTLTIEKDGTYRVSANVSFSGDDGEFIKMHLFNNGVRIPKAGLVRRLGSTGDVGSSSFSCFLTLAAGDVLDVRFTSQIAGVYINIENMNFNIKRANQ